MRILLIVLCLGCASSAFGQSLRFPSAVYLASGQADAWSTKWTPGVREDNPIGRWLHARGGEPAFVTGAAVGDALTVWFVSKTLGVHHRRAAAIVLYGLSAVRVEFAVHNRLLSPESPRGLQTFHRITP